MANWHQKYSVIRNVINLLKGEKGVFFDKGRRATPLLKQVKYPFNPLAYVPQETSTFKKVIYVCSPTQRSGTNFIFNTLKLHADIASPESPSMPKEHFLYSHADQLSEYISKTLGYWPKWVENEESLQKTHAALLSEIGEGILRVFYQELPDPNKILMLRTPDAGNLEFFPALFPNGKLVVILRDGRDTVNSFVESFSGEWAFNKMAKRWASRIEYLFQVNKQMIEAGFQDRIGIFKYEDLNSEPEKTVKAILKYLSLDEAGYDWEKLKSVPVVGSSTQYNEQGKGDFWAPKEKSDSKKFSNKWKMWSSSKKKNFKKIAGNQLIRAGYETDLNW